MTERAQPVALVTGAGRGLGRAIAGALHRDGYKVAVTDVDEGAAVSVAQSLSADGSTARAYRLDVSSAQQVADVFASVARDLGLPDALVNNAGIYPSHSILDMPEAAWDSVLGHQLEGPFPLQPASLRSRACAHRRQFSLTRSCPDSCGKGRAPHTAACPGAAARCRGGCYCSRRRPQRTLRSCCRSSCAPDP